MKKMMKDIKEFDAKKFAKSLIVDEKAVAKAKLIKEISDVTCLKKAYFECLPEEEFDKWVESYKNGELEKKEEEEITISMDEYSRLLDSEHFLNCLEACGVDNWSGYGDAYEMAQDEEE